MAKKKAADFKGVDIREVFDWRLSKGAPYLFNSGEFWIVKIMANDAPDGESVVLAEHTTKAPTTINGLQDPHEAAGVTACYEWLHSVRDQFSRDNIELRKPVAAMINAANQDAAILSGRALAAEIAGEKDEFYRCKGELAAHLSAVNAAIKAATKSMQDQIANPAGA